MEKYYSKYPEINLINIICFWHVSSFGLISGIVGYKSNKYSNLLHLWLITCFYSVGIYILVRQYKPLWIKNDDFLYQYCLPVIFVKYWYFTKYFGMYLFLPVINKGISILTKIELKLLVISIISFLIIWQNILNPKNDIFNLAGGYSILGLLIFYLTGSYIGKYRISYIGIKKVLFCLLCIILFIFATLFCYKIQYYKITTNNYYKIKFILILKKLFVKRISSLPMIIQTNSIILFLMQIKYNKYIAKIISFIGPLTFGVYIIHCHPLLKWNFFGNMIKKEMKNMSSLNSIINFLVIKGLELFGICLLIEYLRSLLFGVCRIRKICILLENLIFRLFK